MNQQSRLDQLSEEFRNLGVLASGLACQAQLIADAYRRGEWILPEKIERDVERLQEMHDAQGSRLATLREVTRPT